ncbi:MAG: AAA family ATPase [Bacteroidales bacterium]|nr:AAA family ATPase [Bacteroidales bacterium]
MKIKKLEILNLASIKEAVIDFDKGPLSDAELFLITGTTGSGKTTLLDAISIALYNTTPRISKSKKEKTEANEDNLSGRDPRNLMRQNTGYAYSKLWFVGNDGANYLAEWSVSRGKNCKVNVGLSNELWSITNLDTSATTSAQKHPDYNAVAAVIVNAVGLDFNQFCRTTMLAQGEFTEFLKSDEGAKADILEKISGTEVYRKIGMAIHDQFNKIEKKLKDAQSKHDSIVTLPAEERQALEDELEQIDATIATLATKAEALQKCTAWLEGKESLEAKVEKAKKDLQEAEETISSADFIQRKKTSDQWAETVEVREALANARRHKANAESATVRLAGLENEFREALAGEAYEIENLKETLHKLDQTQKVVEAHSQNVSVYDNDQTIIADIKSWESECVTVEKSKGELKTKEETDLPAAEHALNEADHLLAVAVKAEEESLKLMEAANGQLAALNLAMLRNEKEFLTSVKTIKETIDGYRHDIEKTKGSIALSESQLEILKAKAVAENAELARLEEEHKRRELTIETLAKEMRTMLHAGLGNTDNLCPVCGQVVTELKADALLDEEYKKIKEEFKAQDKKAKDATAAAASLENLIKVTGETLDGLNIKLDKEVVKLSNSIEGRHDAQTLNDASTDSIGSMITSLQEKISEGEKIELKKQELAKAHTDCLKRKGEATNARTKSAAAVDLVKKEITTLKDKISESENKKEALVTKINVALTGSLAWDNNWNDDTEAFTAELKAKAAEYRAAVESAGRLTVAADQIRPILKFIADVKGEILTAMPKWSADGVLPPKAKNGLQHIWATLKSNVSTELSTITNESKAHKGYAAKVEEFLNCHQEYSIETLEHLMTISNNAHINEDAYLNSRLAEHKTAMAACKSAEEELVAHIANRPVTLKEEDTKESLKAETDYIGELRDASNTRKGNIQNELKVDNEARLKKGNTMLLDQLKEEYAHWHSFHKLFGDSSGDKLSKTAQSYVLESLLVNANRHLKNMAPRYRLLVNPGTLNLKLEDQYNDYQTRSTNSISGGESFLVSLALALALADFGQHLGVSMLFIDEGFGTLSGEALQNAINTLKSLHSDSGRQVGIISHREEIRYSIPVQIKVNLSQGTSASTVEISE